MQSENGRRGHGHAYPTTMLQRGLLPGKTPQSAEVALRGLQQALEDSSLKIDAATSNTGWKSHTVRMNYILHGIFLHRFVT